MRDKGYYTKYCTKCGKNVDDDPKHDCGEYVPPRRAPNTQTETLTWHLFAEECPHEEGYYLVHHSWQSSAPWPSKEKVINSDIGIYNWNGVSFESTSRDFYILGEDDGEELIAWSPMPKGWRE